MAVKRSLSVEDAFDKDINTLINALNALGDKKMIALATNRGINRVRKTLTSNAVPRAARSANLMAYHIRRKIPAKFGHNATPKIPQAKITIRRTDMAAISLFAKPTNSRKGAAIAHKRGDLDIGAIAQASNRGRHSKAIKIGKGKSARTFTGAFISQGKRRATDPQYNDYVMRSLGAKKNVLAGRFYQVLKRVGPKPYPLEVVKIPLKAALTGSFRAATRSVIRPGGAATKIMDASFRHAVKTKLGISRFTTT